MLGYLVINFKEKNIYTVKKRKLIVLQRSCVNKTMTIKVAANRLNFSGVTKATFIAIIMFLLKMSSKAMKKYFHSIFINIIVLYHFLFLVNRIS